MGDCLIRKTTERNVKPEVNRPITAPVPSESQPMAAIVLSNDDSTKQSEKKSRLIKQRASAGLRSSAKRLKTIREGSAGQSTSASSARSYSFTDFRIYDEYERQKTDAKAEVDLHKQETEMNKKSTNANAPTIILNKADNDFEPQATSSDVHRTPSPDLSESSKKEIKYQLYKQFMDRRNVSSYVKNHILGSVAVA